MSHSITACVHLACTHTHTHTLGYRLSYFSCICGGVVAVTDATVTYFVNANNISPFSHTQGWLVCDDQACRYRTRQPTICLEDSAPLCPNCHQGKLKEEVG